MNTTLARGWAFFGNVAMVSSDNIYKLHARGFDSIDAFNEQRINYIFLVGRSNKNSYVVAGVGKTVGELVLTSFD
jgi:hypothetical protein